MTEIAFATFLSNFEDVGVFAGCSLCAEKSLEYLYPCRTAYRRGGGESWRADVRTPRAPTGTTGGYMSRPVIMKLREIGNHFDISVISL